MMELGKLQGVDLRQVWQDESRDFTPWLATDANMAILNETLGMSLEVEDQEVSVGPYYADILCKDTADDSWVVIENQIEKTDHDHLGKVLTYAAGLGAKSMIWIARKFTEEHRAALDWLNEHTLDDISFFGLEIEVWRIGESPAAPKFNIVCKPNDWSKSVKSSAAGVGNVSEHKKLQLEFWTALKAWGEANGRIQLGKPAPQHWTNVSAGRSGFHYALITSYWSAVTNTKGSEIRINLILSSAGSKAQFERLRSQEKELQAQIDLPLHWYSQEGVRACRVFVRREADFSDRSQWNEQFAWLAQYLSLFRKVFGPEIKKL